MRTALISVALVLGLTCPAYGAYDHVGGGTASPSAVTAGGTTGYSVALTGRSAVTDVVFAVDQSGSMATTFGGVSRWDAVRSALFGSGGFLDTLVSRGLFTGGGRVGVVAYTDTATTAIAPSTDVAAIKTSLNGLSPATGSRLGCGLQTALNLLAAVPGAASHRQLVYMIGDGPETVSAGGLTTAIAAADAAHVERRDIGVDASSLTDLDRADSSGAAQPTANTSQLAAALAAETTVFPGATAITWTFRLTSGFTASTPTPSTGTVAINGQDLVWTIPSLGDATVNLSFNAVHAASSGCGQTALLTGTSFTDAEGDTAPPAGLGPLTVSGCPPPDVAPPSTGGTTTPPSGTPAPPGGTSPVPVAGPSVTKVALAGSQISASSTTTLTLTLGTAAKVRLSFARALAGRRAGGRCVAPTRANRRKARCTRYVPAGTLTKSLGAGPQRLTVGTRLDGGRRLRPGTYRVTVSATGPDGRSVTAKTLALKVVARR